jgi:hypothetical protein
MLVEFAIHNSFDLSDIWSEVIKALSLMRYFDYNIEKKWEVGYTYAVVLSTSSVDTRPPLLR